MRATELLDPYLDHLKALPFVKGIKVEQPPWMAGTGLRIRPDARITLRTPTGDYAILAEVKRTNLTQPLVDSVLAQMKALTKGSWILFAPHVGRHLGKYLRERRANYVDFAGNCYVEIGKTYVASIEGRRRDRRVALDKSIRGPGFQILFALLAKAELLHEPVRTLAQAAGVGKTAAADMLKRLEQEGLIGIDQGGRRVLGFQALLDRWLTGYVTMLRPRLMMGRFVTNDPDPRTREHRIERELGETTAWAWGGGTAAMHLTGHYHGPFTVLHLQLPIPAAGQRLKAIQSIDGPLVLLRAPGPVAFEGVKPRTVHPLLVYTELLVTGDERAHEAAQEIRTLYLPERG